MQVEQVKLALALIVKPGEEKYLRRVLKYTARFVDGVFITITGKDEEIEKLCKEYGANVSHYEWDWHFANARNFNFQQVPKEYTHILWMDADDLLRHIGKYEDLSDLRETLKNNLDVDCFLMNYAYAFDEWKNPIIIHLKTQIVKNDDCVEWVGRLHEDFRPKRQLNIKLLKDFERLHMTDDERLGQAKERNLKIAEIEFEKNPEDPRSFWNLANAQKAAFKDEDALKTFDQFLKMSESDDEKYIAMLRMAEIYIGKKQYSKALDVVKYAIGTKPDYPDAYHIAGNLYAELKDFYKARDSYLRGFDVLKKYGAPKYDIIIYNPRDYDYHPLKNLAFVYIELGLPTQAHGLLKKCHEISPNDEQINILLKVVEKESRKFKKILKKVEELQKIKDLKILKEELDKLPEDYASHPAVLQIRNINFIKDTSSGKEVVFFTGQTPEMWNPDTVKEKGIGGSEEAVINLSNKFTKAGYEVTVYANCGRDVKVYEGVTWKPWWMFNVRDRADYVILWRSPMMLDHQINAKKVYVDLHDTFEEGEFTPSRMSRLDKIFVKSKAHRDLYPNLPDDKFIILPNGIDFSYFDQHKGVTRDPYFLVNFSSPDRSLNGLLDIYAEVLKRVSPEIRDKVKLAWYYGWQLFDQLRTTPRDVEWKAMVQKKWQTMGDKVEGGKRITHEQVAILNMIAGALVYPSQFYEIDWVGGSKAQLAGCYLITTNFAAIGEKNKYGVQVDTSHLPIKNGLDYSCLDPKVKERFVELIVGYLNNPEKVLHEREQMETWARKEFDLDRIAGEWIKEFEAVKILKTNVLPHNVVLD